MNSNRTSIIRRIHDWQNQRRGVSAIPYEAPERESFAPNDLA